MATLKLPADIIREVVRKAVDQFVLDEDAIRADERAKVAEEIAQAIHERFDHLVPRYHGSMIAIAQWCEDEAREHGKRLA